VLSKLAADFARAVKAADAERPVAISSTTRRAYQAGIGPHTETSTLALVRAKLPSINPTIYSQIETGVPYPNAPRQKCDWHWTLPSGESFYIEAKMMRLMGDNGKPNDNILSHILSPYPQQRSALTDCQKLVNAGFGGSLAILIYGYEYEGYPLEPVIRAFETLASKVVTLSPASAATFSGLVHPVHKQGTVYGWTIKALAP
jgi:hypothetical protein